MPVWLSRQLDWAIQRDGALADGKDEYVATNTGRGDTAPANTRLEDTAPANTGLGGEPSVKPWLLRPPWIWIRWCLALVIVVLAAGFSAHWLVKGEKHSCVATNVTRKYTKAGVSGTSTASVTRHVCGPPDRSGYLYVLAVAGILLLPDVQSLKFGGFEFNRLSNEVANQAVQVKEQTEEVAKQSEQIQKLQNAISQVVHTSQILNLALGPAAGAAQGDAVGPRRAEGITEVPEAVHQRVIGPVRPETLTARANLAQLIGEAGDPAGARDRYKALLAVMDPDKPETLNARAELAHWTGEAGDPTGARKQYTALLRDMERVHSDDRDILTARANLAWYTGLEGDAASARDQYAALLRDGERLHSDDRDILITALNYWTDKANGGSNSSGN